MRTLLVLLVGCMISTSALAQGAVFDASRVATADISPAEARSANADGSLAEARSANADGSLAEARSANADGSLAEARSAKADETWREARIRPQDPRLVELIREGLARSATFRDLVRRLESGNLIVYVTLSPNMRASLAGKLTWMSKSGAYRYMRATINTEQSSSQMIATLAHELQHALEVGAEESVIDQRSLAGLYKRIGRPSSTGVAGGFETVAAQETGLQVRRELGAAAAAAAAASRGADNSQS